VKLHIIILCILLLFSYVILSFILICNKKASFIVKSCFIVVDVGIASSMDVDCFGKLIFLVYEVVAVHF